MAVFNRFADDQFDDDDDQYGGGLYNPSVIARNVAPVPVPVAAPALALETEYVHNPSFQNITGKGSTGFEPWKNVGRVPVFPDAWDPFGNYDPYGGGLFDRNKPGGILSDLLQFGVGLLLPDL